ncbi:hypothetical protein [Staphylococcus epidermidis]
MNYVNNGEKECIKDMICEGGLRSEVKEVVEQGKVVDEGMK